MKVGQLRLLKVVKLAQLFINSQSGRICEINMTSARITNLKTKRTLQHGIVIVLNISE